MMTGPVAGLGGLAAIAMMTLVMGGIVQADEVEPRRTISVMGRGQVTVAPDLAFMTLSVETTAVTAGDASSQNAKKSNRVIKAVKKHLGDDDALKTTGYNLQPRYGERKPGSRTPPEIVGYVANNQVRVTTHELDKVGAILDAALEAGANRSSGLSFGIEDRNPPTRLALAAAGAEARAQAESIAAALGVRLGAVLTASTSSPNVISPPVLKMARSFEAASPTPIEAGEETVSATLHVTYAIIDAE